ncbi:FliC/FljB family flagellin [Edwardsiella tarda]|uniref:FliC/FljB family flagellin n=1 Tax=Edwardsiella tarda TaxID=636 RepID=UPI00266EEBCF|nr:FliC/FljB family flagellin [Edwardsiella tarda]WKS82369.1 FliC/FljB family flagellin [Edwardsiella tarda]
MAQVINTNSLSLMAQNNLNKSQSALGTAIERLSSGLRINSAKDDAAGQAISNRFTANINGLTQASRNANDGISLAQTTEGALNEVNDNLQNIRRLAVQAQNGSNSSSDLQSIQDEITQRLSEIDRISQQTDFNGVKVLSKDQKLTIQVGANDGETIDIDLKNINADSLNLKDFSVSNKANQVGGKVTDASIERPLTKGKVTGGDKPFDGVVSYKDGADTKYAVVDNTTDPKAPKYYEATIQTNGTVDYNTGNDVSADVKADTAHKDITKSVNIDTSSLAANEELHSFTDKDGKAGYIIKTTGSDGAVTYTDATVDKNTGVITKTAGNNKDAYEPLAALDSALSQVDKLRSGLGAVQNRFDSVINNLNSTVNNLSASRSRIQDADYATEVSNMSRAQILQQAGTSVLAQANQSTQNVLSLLR